MSTINPLPYEQQKQAVFLHHTLWHFGRQLPITQVELKSSIEYLRKTMEESGCFRGIHEDLYTHYVAKGGIMILHETIN